MSGEPNNPLIHLQRRTLKEACEIFDSTEFGEVVIKRAAIQDEITIYGFFISDFTQENSVSGELVKILPSFIANSDFRLDNNSIVLRPGNQPDGEPEAYMSYEHCCLNFSDVANLIELNSHVAEKKVSVKRGRRRTHDHEDIETLILTILETNSGLSNNQICNEVRLKMNLQNNAAPAISTIDRIITNSNPIKKFRASGGS